VLLAAVALGVWVGLAAEVEGPSWALSAAYAIIVAGGIAAGVVVRRVFARR
jgi:hypothetical protein